MVNLWLYLDPHIFLVFCLIVFAQSPYYNFLLFDKHHYVSGFLLFPYFHDTVALVHWLDGTNFYLSLDDTVDYIIDDNTCLLQVSILPSLGSILITSLAAPLADNLISNGVETTRVNVHISCALGFYIQKASMSLSLVWNLTFFSSPIFTYFRVLFFLQFICLDVSSYGIIIP